MDDLFQVGCIGLIKVADNFDPAREVMFSTYAVPMILGDVHRFLRDSAAVRISHSTCDLAYRALTVREELAAENQKKPTVDEIAGRRQNADGNCVRNRHIAGAGIPAGKGGTGKAPPAAVVLSGGLRNRLNLCE